MAPRYIHTEKALSDLSPVMPVTLSDAVSPEENAGDFKMPCTYTKNILHFIPAYSIHYRPTPLKSVALHLEKI